MRIAFLDCFSGISGDMFLGALVDAGVPLEVLADIAASLNVGARLEARKVIRGGITGTKVDVLTAENAASHDGATPTEASHQPTQAHARAQDHGHAHTHDHDQDRDHAHGGHSHGHDHPHPHDHAHDPAHEHAHQHHRSLTTILGIIASAALDDAVKANASRAFRLLGEAEAAVHSIPVETVHFHEVGAVDTIVDIVCAAAGAAHLGVDRWIASPLNVGSGTVDCAHGTLPVPAPASVKLLGSAPVYAAGPAMERVTPTGAAILRMLHVEYAALPPMRLQSSGYGAGGRDTPGRPNLLRILVGDEQAAAEPVSLVNGRLDPEGMARSAVGPTAGGEPIAILETVIDDSTPQLLAYVSELLLDSGAWDVYRIPVQMKKGRTGVQLTVLCAPDRLNALREILFRETTTIGAHWRIENKIALGREFTQVDTPWGKVRMKVARAATGEILNAAPEYEDCRRIAADSKVALKQVMQAALHAWASQGGKQP